MYLGYRSDKRRAEYALQFPRTPTPTAVRTLSTHSPVMAEVPQRQAPKSADGSTSNAPWGVSRQSGEALAPSIRPQKAVPQPGAVPTRSSLSSRNGANGSTRPQTAVSAGAGSAGAGSFHAGSFHAASFHGGGGGSVGGRS